MSREQVLEEFGIPISEWGNCEAMADEIVCLRARLEAADDLSREACDFIARADESLDGDVPYDKLGKSLVAYWDAKEMTP
jgi:hypothetical protein